MLAAAASSIHWLARPHLFTLLFLVLFYAALEEVREGREPAVRASRIWRSCRSHGSVDQPARRILRRHCGDRDYTVLANSCSRPYWDPEPQRPQAGRRRAYFLSAVGGLAASLINPYIYHLHVHMAQYLRDPFNSRAHRGIPIAQFPSSGRRFFEVMLVLGAVAAFWNLAKGATPRRCCCWSWRTPGFWRRATFRCSHDRGRPAGGRSGPGMAEPGCRMERGRLAAAGWRTIQPGGGGDGRDRSHRPLGTWSASPAWRWWWRCSSRPIRPSISAPNSTPRSIPPAALALLQPRSVGTAFSRKTSGATI